MESVTKNRFEDINSHDENQASEKEVVLQLSGVNKYFGGVKVVDNVNFKVRKGEILTLLGHSGCGKSTTLRMIVGLEECDEGVITYQNRVIDSGDKKTFVPPHKRGMGMVFQSYAIWPHMTVFENVAYPLRVAKMKRNLIKEKVENILNSTGLYKFKERRSTQLSGGQQQRVALARSLVSEPNLLLLDEPFSNLDALLREHMRIELKQLQRQLGITIIFVTHDQEEALALSDKILLMNDGKIEQLGRPEELYYRPKTRVVRNFLGKNIIIEGVIANISNNQATINLGGMLNYSVNCRLIEEHTNVALGGKCEIAYRPEDFKAALDTEEMNENSHITVRARIITLLFLGGHYEASVELPWQQTALIQLPTEGKWKEGHTINLLVPREVNTIWPT